MVLSSFGMRSKGGIKAEKKDKDFKGRLIAVDKEIMADVRGRNRTYYYFTIKGLFSEHTYWLEGEPASHNLKRYYTLGEKVQHIAGYPVPIKAKRRPGQLKICIDCGELIPMGHGRCVYCGKGVRNV